MTILASFYRKMLFRLLGEAINKALKKITLDNGHMVDINEENTKAVRKCYIIFKSVNVDCVFRKKRYKLKRRKKVISKTAVTETNHTISLKVSGLDS